MSKEFPELDVAKIQVDETTRSRHMAAIESAIRETRPKVRRFRLLAVAFAWVLLVPVMALASERAVPGDFLYPIKQILEPVVGVFDSDVAVEHRVEEVEILYERDAPTAVITDHIDVARDAISDAAHADEFAHLTDRIDRVRRDLAERERDIDTHEEPVDEPQDRHSDREGEPPPTTETTHGDRPPRDQG